MLKSSVAAVCISEVQMRLATQLLQLVWVNLANLVMNLSINGIKSTSFFLEAQKIKVYPTSTILKITIKYLILIILEKQLHIFFSPVHSNK